MVNAADIFNASILVVDDQQENVRLLVQMLRDAGYLNITSTTDPYTVCDLYRKNHHDLILLDLHMPGMDGFKVMEKLKEAETGSYIPVLVITAQPYHNLRALDSGARDFISKPFDLREAKTRIHNLLESRLLHKKLEYYNRELESLALHDPLTGLPNRRLLMDRLSLSLAHVRRNDFSMAVIYLDLDGFKQINDTLGHDAGDTLLCMVATRLVQSVRQEDTVSRLGGDEFVIVLWDLNHDNNVSNLVLKLIEAVSQPYSIKGHGVSVTASIGASIFPLHGDNAETLMELADKAMYEAKRAGKNNYRIAEHKELMEEEK